MDYGHLLRTKLEAKGVDSKERVMASQHYTEIFQVLEEMADRHGAYPLRIALCVFGSVFGMQAFNPLRTDLIRMLTHKNSYSNSLRIISLDQALERIYPSLDFSKDKLKSGRRVTGLPNLTSNSTLIYSDESRLDDYLRERSSTTVVTLVDVSRMRKL